MPISTETFFKKVEIFMSECTGELNYFMMSRLQTPDGGHNYDAYQEEPERLEEVVTGVAYVLSAAEACLRGEIEERPNQYHYIHRYCGGCGKLASGLAWMYNPYTGVILVNGVQ